MSRDKGTTRKKSLHCPRTKEQKDKLKILPRNGPGFLQLVPSRNIRGQPRDRRGKKGKKLQFLNFWQFLIFLNIFFCQSGSGFVPGRCRTKVFVLGFLLLLLSRDKGTPGQWNFFCPRTKGRQDKETFLSWDKGTMGRSVPDCPVETLACTVPNYF